MELEDTEDSVHNGEMGELLGLDAKIPGGKYDPSGWSRPLHFYVKKCWLEETLSRFLSIHSDGAEVTDWHLKGIH